MTDIKSKIAAVFEANPDVEKLHVTTDGNCFVKNNSAILHAGTLADQKIEMALRGDYVTAAKPATKKEVEAPAADAKPAPVAEKKADTKTSKK